MKFRKCSTVQGTHTVDLNDTYHKDCHVMKTKSIKLGWK